MEQVYTSTEKVIPCVLLMIGVIAVLVFSYLLACPMLQLVQNKCRPK